MLTLIIPLLLGTTLRQKMFPVHRKGAIRAEKGELGIIPGNALGFLTGCIVEGLCRQPFKSSTQLSRALDA